LQRLDPSFDFRAQGYATFTKYLEASPEVAVTRPRGPGDVMVELKEVKEAEPQRVVPQPSIVDWGVQVDAAWSRRAPKPGQALSGAVAASAAARILGVSRLSDSRYKTLQRLLDAAPELRGNWRREVNKIVRK
jgi:hypothetical protein